MKCNGTGHHANVGVEAHWSLEQVNALTRSFLADCQALESACDERTKLDLIRQVMRHHIDNAWSNTEVLALERLMFYYRSRLLDRQLSSFLAICCIQRSSGWTVMPAIATLRVSRWNHDLAYVSRNNSVRVTLRSIE